jgi:hypothetical protein
MFNECKIAEGKLDLSRQEHKGQGGLLVDILTNEEAGKP